jgi:predicted 2-oxoglutarate/Fe(II)-dependent dioxygenase YbiX
MPTPLIVPGFMKADVCAELRTVYAAGLASGSIRPRGITTTDIALTAVLAVPTVVDDVADLLRARFDLPELRPDYVAYTRVLAGGSHVLHADGVKLDGTPNHTPRRVASAMLYLSDGETDFTGGLLRFPMLGMEIVPHPGLLVGFLTTLEHQHEVTLVTSGVRDAIAMWFFPA